MEKRASGILMHISSLPGQFGIGTFGKEAYQFVDFLKETKQSYWQILPLSPTSYGDSPYQSFSAVAGNTHFIDFDLLVKDGLLVKSDFQDVDFGSDIESVDYELIFEARRPILEKAVSNFLTIAKNRTLLEAFEEEATWLADYAEFMAFKEFFGNKSLQEWDDLNLVNRSELALATYRQKLKKEITYHKVVQYFFNKQWLALKTYANENGIEIIGDMPIYVSADSVEVWTMPELFKVDENKNPLFVAGVPADDFSDTGQLWGNPIYDWQNHKESNYQWWVYRIKESFKLYDILRIDHFKGFSDFWEVAGDAEIAKVGQWLPGPGYELFKVIKEELGDLPIIAEDLGNIDEKARQLLYDTGFPGMKVLQFGYFDVKAKSIDIAFRCVPNSVAYLGTHDNEVINGWYNNLDKEQQDFVNNYTNRRKDQAINQVMLKLLFSTASNTAIISMQDLLDKPEESRMNRPSTVGGNWQWRMLSEDISSETKSFLKEITALYGRIATENK
ncbi:4-alpha-glucanotransferase [Streptococcus urinalis FB127-CNA-2]|uniref:4-alpha-glucanotransferase n=2 Tax=Streptococcus urinalis TaxID=149016 RepID=G5KHD2_9STRE|nr:4-alpha-glucanotransferase [Streptococcus urinalis 2285-97]EKS22491.1 4-alpha-glucanotransferase [Streptococcus urinalis FB127-CNA-2]VEF32304.1 4-alpha-glucanotransferase [Streptococcus urinalis]